MAETLDRMGRAWAELLQRFAEGNWVVSWVGVAATSLIALLVFLLLRALVRRGLGWMLEGSGTRLPSIRFQNQEIFTRTEVLRLAVGALRLLSYGVYALLLALYLQTVFAFFPATRGIALALYGGLASAVVGVARSVVDYLPNLAFVAVIYFFGRFLIHATRVVFDGIEAGRIRLPGFYPEWSSTTFNLVRGLIVVFLVIVIFPYLPGAQSPAFQGVSIFLGVLLSLGSSGAVANMVSGLVLTYMRAFHVGDRVKIADAVGDVVERTIFVTRVRTIKNVDITIPNAMVLGNHIVNYSSQAKVGGVTLHTTVTLGYDVPWRRVHELLIDAARATGRIEAEPAPFVLQTALDDFYVQYELNAATREPERMAAIYSELHQQVQDRLHAAGIEIASPHLAAIRDGNRASVPEEHLPRDYRPPAFRVLPLSPEPQPQR
jgi:small-conductance mechanosensitive channel